jgi:hypothetical protein
MFGYVNDEPEQRGDFFLFYSYAHLAGGPLLASLVSGKAATEFENQSPKEAVIRVMGVLRRIFEPKGVTVPMPVQVLPVVSRLYSQRYLSLFCVQPEYCCVGRVLLKLFLGSADSRTYHRPLGHV